MNRNRRQTADGRWCCHLPYGCAGFDDDPFILPDRQPVVAKIDLGASSCSAGKLSLRGRNAYDTSGYEGLDLVRLGADSLENLSTVLA